MDKLYMGIDLGGTNVRAGLVAKGQLLSSASVRIAELRTEGEVIDQICALIGSIGLEDVSGIGIGVPSIVDPVKGIVYDTVNIPSWKEVHLKAILEERFGVPVAINNDANCFALGEQRHGSARGFSTIVGVTIGTGLGAGIVIEGRLFNGTNCGAGEVGNIPYLGSTIEGYASGQYFTTFHGQSGESLLDLALKDDAGALAIFEEYGLHLGKALLTIIYAYDPEMIVLGGSVRQSYPFFEKSMWRALQTSVFPHALAGLRVECSRLKDIALIGAASLVE